MKNLASTLASLFALWLGLKTIPLTLGDFWVGNVGQECWEHWVA